MIALQLCSLCNVVFATLHTILSYCTLFTNATRKFPQVPTSQHMDLKAGIHRLNDTVIYVVTVKSASARTSANPRQSNGRHTMLIALAELPHNTPFHVLLLSLLLSHTCTYLQDEQGNPVSAQRAKAIRQLMLSSFRQLET